MRRKSNYFNRFEALETRYALDAEAALIGDLKPGAGDSQPSQFVASGEQVFFAARQERSPQLWRVDAGGELHFVEGLNVSRGSNLVSVGMGGDLYATIKPGVNELVRIDGETGAVTTLHTSPYVRNLCALGDRVFFSDNDNGNSSNLWMTDGTVEGTRLVEHVFSVTKFLGTTNKALYYTKGPKLWRTDGTEAGTVMVGDIPGVSSSSTAFRSDGNIVYIAPGFDKGIWRTDGTPEGTIHFDDRPFGLGQEFALVDDALYFLQSDPPGAFEIRRIGPNDQASTLVTEFVNLNFPARFVALDGKLFFYHRDSHNDQGHFWVSDGTPEGTHPVVNQRGDDFPQTIYQMVATSDRIYFVDNDEASGDRLWESDGTAAGTRQVGHFESPRELTAIGNALYLSFRTEEYGDEPWVVRSTPNRTSDLNGDGQVDLADFSIFKANFGAKSDQGDIDGNGQVDLSDFGLLKQALGTVPATADAWRAAAIDQAMRGSLEDELEL